MTTHRTPDEASVLPWLKVRLRYTEMESFQMAAELAGITLSEWVRERLRRAAIRELEDVGQRAPIIRHLYPQKS